MTVLTVYTQNLLINPQLKSVSWGLALRGVALLLGCGLALGGVALLLGYFITASLHSVLVFRREISLALA